MTRNNPEKEKEYHKMYYEKNRKELIKKAMKYNLNNPRDRKEYYKEYNKRYRETHKEEIKKYKEDTKERDRINRAKTIRKNKMKVFEMLAEHHKTKMECWRCHEGRLWCLTIGHINQNGHIDRDRYRGGGLFYKTILKGERDISDLRIECMNCNCCHGYYGEYPDEITEESFKHSETQRERYK